MLVRPCGDQAVIIDVLNEDAEAVRGSVLDAVLALNRALRAAEIPGVIDLVPAARTLLAVLDTRRISPQNFARTVDSLRLSPTAATGSAPEPVEIPVRYDGPDLVEVAELTGLSTAELIRVHSSTLWTAAFGGFAPGFSYLVPQTPLFDIPRRPSPRTRIPAGSVGLAGNFSAVYPQQSPGGWQLIGTTELPMWDVDRAVPALLRAGDTVRFVAVK